MSFFGNITFRRGARTKSETENEADNDTSSQIIDGSSCSLPNISDDESDSVNTQVEELKLQLAIAHNEVKELSLENASLTSELEALRKKYELLKKLSKYSTPQKPKSSTHTRTPSKNALKVDDCKAKTTQTLVYLTDIETTNQDTKKTEENRKTRIDSENYIKKTSNNKLSTTNTTHKISILSTNRNSHVLETAEATFQSNKKIYHYLKTNCGVENLLTGIEHSVKNLTNEDFCVIMIGEQDFIETNNYAHLVNLIKSTLQKFQHTNFIICLPTYQCAQYKTMFNYRIETFNNLLWLDAATYEYAYILDSNLELTYNAKMFDHRRGTVNSKGINVIMKNLHDLIVQILDCNTEETKDSEPAPGLATELFRM